MDVLFEPLSLEFFRHALLVCTLAGALCGLLAGWLVLGGFRPR